MQMMSWLRLWIACSVLFPLVGEACDKVDRQRCKDQIGELVSYRTAAIERAFGDFISVMPEKIAIKFVGPADTEYKRYSRKVAYDLAQETLIIPRYLLSARIPKPLRASGSYWPFYQNELYRQTFPIISAVDNALWGAYLQEAAQVRGLSWPHANCGSVDLGERLPCEMLVEGISEHLTAARTPLFNSNRLDRIWPQDFASFSEQVWRKDDPRYIEVQRYGGWMLVKPLFDEFGIPRVLVYLAQTPFVVEQNDLESSALRYQIRARESLEAEVGNKLIQTAEAESLRGTAD
jgi:hypothetical protein